MSLRVTVVDEQTGEIEVKRVPAGSYLLAVVPPCRLAKASRSETSATLVIEEYAPQELPPDPRRIQRQRTKGWRMPARAVYVGRPSQWGNPYRVGDHWLQDPDHTKMPYTLDDTIGLYRIALERRLEEDPDFLQPLRGKALVCWCPLDQPCHVDVLLDLLDRG